MTTTKQNSVILDKTDFHIIASLQNDSRTQYRKLARETDKALGTISNRIQRLEDLNIIQYYTCKINPEKLGFDLTVLINIQIDVMYLDEVNNALKEIPELFALYNVTGNFDIISIGRFRNRQHLDQTIHRIIKIPHIQRTFSNVALRTLKEDFRVHVEYETR